MRINVQDLGAAGDGSHNDHGAIQDALDRVLPGGVVYFPSGSYKVDAPLRIAGKDHVTIMSDGVAGLVCYGQGYFLEIVSCESARIENVHFSATGNNGNNGLQINSSPGMYLGNVLIWGAQNHQVYIVGSWSVTTERCVFDCLSANSGSAAFYHDSQSNHISHHRSRFVGRSEGIGAFVRSGASITFDSCDFSGSLGGESTGLDIRGVYSLNVRNCYFEWNGRYGVHIGSHEGAYPVNVNIEGSYFNLNDNVGNIGVFINHNVSYANVENNVFLGNDAEGSKAIQNADDPGSHHIVIGEQFIYGVDQP